MVLKKQKEKDKKMTATLIIIGVFAGFFFLVVRPLQKRSGKYDVELPSENPDFPGGHFDSVVDPSFRHIPGNIFHHDD